MLDNVHCRYGNGAALPSIGCKLQLMGLWNKARGACSEHFRFRYKPSDFYNNGAFSNSFFRADYSSLKIKPGRSADRQSGSLVFQFVASWAGRKEKGPEIFWLTYEDLINKPATIKTFSILAALHEA
jgi:hypothetical protein